MVDDATPLKFAVDPPCVVPKPEPLMVKREPGAPEVFDSPVMVGFGNEDPRVSETLSNVAVPRPVPPPLVVARPTYTVCVEAIVCVVPICVQLLPSPEMKPLNVF